MIRLIYILALSHIVFSSFGQPSDSVAQKKPKRVIMGFYSGGSAVYGDFSSLNNAIGPAGYPAAPDRYIGGSFGFTFRKFDRNAYSSFVVSFCRSVPSPFYDNSRIKDTRVNMIEFSVLNHFDLNLHPKWLLYPSIGFGFGNARLTLYDNVNTQTSFAASISNLNLPSSKQWSAGYVFLDAGVGIERKLRIWIYDFYLGGGAGYRLSTNARFRESYQSYNDAPSVQLSGVTWNFKIRFELWKNRVIKRN